jgi:site-specific DNA recombinase
VLSVPSIQTVVLCSFELLLWRVAEWRFPLEWRRDTSGSANSSYHDGHACSNAIRVRRERVEAVLLGPLNENLGNPDRVARMVAEMEAYYLERLRVLEARDVDCPRELQELSARIARLKERLRCGDPDMTADELQAAIDRAEMKWRELQSQAAPGRSLSKLFATLPRGAELYRRQVILGLSGDLNAASKARVFLRKWFGGKIRLDPLPDGGLMAHWNQNVAALVDGLGTCGSGARYGLFLACRGACV